MDSTAMKPITFFFSGIYLATFVTSALIFFRVWRKVHDRFFALFGFAALVLGLERIPLLFIDPTIEENSWVYVFRLTSFVLILMAVVDTNRVERTSSGPRS